MTLQLVTADVPALRAARRQVVAWESLGVVGADRVHVVVNRFVRRSEIQQDTIDMLTLGERSQILIPDLERGLERAGNSRTPAEVRNQVWWRSLRTIGAELDVTSAYREALAAATATARTRPTRPLRRRRRKCARADGHRPRARSPADDGARAAGARRVVVESGQATLETVAMFPFALLILAIALQTILLGVTFAYSGVAAGAAARAVSLGNNPQAAVADALPGGMHSKVTRHPAAVRRCRSRSGPAADRQRRDPRRARSTSTTAWWRSPDERQRPPPLSRYVRTRGRSGDRSCGRRIAVRARSSSWPWCRWCWRCWSARCR